MAGIYIHIPFCKKRCIYCDFYSTTDNALIETYIDSLCSELNYRIGELNELVPTIYIGGGTPSQLSISQLQRLIKFIKSRIDFSLVKEFTIEMNPDDVTEEYIYAYHDMGINRVSMGVQSFVDDELRIINRRHTALQARKAVEIIKDSGISNISIDLIYGLPLQTIDTWRKSLKEAVLLDVPHISCYNLSYEEGTALYKMRECGQVKECEEEVCVQMYELMVAELNINGYERYEISNFAKSGRYSKHNSNYWNLTPYLGLGASAHSFDGVVRRYNPASIKEYISRISSCGFSYEEEHETQWEKFNEYIMVNLRTKWGVDLNKVKEIFGEEMHRHLIIYSKKFKDDGGLVNIDDRIVLSDKGVMLSDYIIRELMFLP